MPKILIVDDEDIVRNTLKRALGRDDMEVTTAATAKEALEILKKERYELILTDVRMPEMDGITFLKEVKKDNAEIPIIVVTGFATIEMTREALQAGAYNFITKPFEIENVLTIVKKGLQVKSEIVRNKEVASFTKCELDIEIPSRENLLGGVVYSILEQARLMSFSPRVIATEILITLDEAITNACKHGNRSDPEKKITVRARVDDKKLDITIKDEGEGFDPNKLINPLSPEGLERNCGRGVFLMNTYMDEVVFNDKGNEVRLVKYNRG